MIYIAFISIFLGVIAQLLMKKGLNEIGTIDILDINKFLFLDVFTNKFVLLGIFCYIFGLLFWLVALSNTDVSKMYPLQGLGYVIVLFGAFIFLGENITFLRGGGIALISLGTFLLLRT